jgi:hypothetical protein
LHDYRDRRTGIRPVSEWVLERCEEVDRG